MLPNGGFVQSGRETTMTSLDKQRTAAHVSSLKLMCAHRDQKLCLLKETPLRGALSRCADKRPPMLALDPAKKLPCLNTPSNRRRSRPRTQPRPNQGEQDMQLSDDDVLEACMCVYVCMGVYVYTHIDTYACVAVAMVVGWNALTKRNARDMARWPRQYTVGFGRRHLDEWAELSAVQFPHAPVVRHPTRAGWPHVTPGHPPTTCANATTYLFETKRQRPESELRGGKRSQRNH